MAIGERLPEPESEPLLPGWYPVGDGAHQRFYAGRGIGWEDAYTLEIHARDPRRPPVSRQSATDVILFLAVCVLAVAGVALLILFG